MPPVVKRRQLGSPLARFLGGGVDAPDEGDLREHGEDELFGIGHYHVWRRADGQD